MQITGVFGGIVVVVVYL